MLIPGLIAMGIAAAAVIAFGRTPARLRGAPLIAVLALAGLALWTLLSFAWTPAKEVAVADAERVLAYVLAYVAGIWVVMALERRMELASLAPAIAGGAVGVATLATIGFGSDVVEYLDREGLLRYPTGYHNAAAAFFMVCALPALALAASRSLHWAARSALASSVTIAVGLATLTQSRGAAFAAVVGFAVLVAASRSRLEVVLWTAIAVLPALPALPVLLDVYVEAGEEGGGLDALHSAAGAIALAAVASALLAALVTRFEGRVSLSSPTRRWIGLGLGALAAVAVVVPVAIAVGRSGGPVDFVDERVDELSAGSPDLRESGSRFGVNLGSDRGDLWGVAADDLAARPLSGRGAGGFEYSYLRERDAPEDLTSEDPHSVEALMASELGLPGLVLFAAFVWAAIAGVLRARRLGPGAPVLAAAALGAFAYWLAHASVDWFWHYAGVTAPVVFLLGAAAAPALREPRERRAGIAGIGVAAALLVVSLAQIPLFLSERYLRDGVAAGASDPAAAYEDLDRAADLNPWTPAPLVAEAQVALRTGDPNRALALLREASKRKPEDWTPHLIAAVTLIPIDADAARRELEEARRLNPQGRRIVEAEAELEAAEAESAR